MTTKTAYPFEVPFETVEADVDLYVSAVFDALRSSFLLLPRGPGFVEYPDFQQAYEVLKRHTNGFRVLEPARAIQALEEDALALVVLRTMLGFTPSEWAYVTSRELEETVSQNFARSVDRRVRIDCQMMRSLSEVSRRRVIAMVTVACQLLQGGAGDAPEGMIHRLDKVDTRLGVDSITHVAAEGLPYAMLLYERFLGRPFAAHRDSVSGLVGAVMESAIEERLRKAGISFRKTKRAERIEGFDQAPDFVIPDEWNPQVVIEAKITEDDGTARDKVTRIQHLAEISNQRRAKGQSAFQVVACIDGRGFGVRREDMRKLLVATRGKVFTLSTLDALVEHTDLRRFSSVS